MNTWIQHDNSYFVVISWNNLYPESYIQDVEEKFNDFNEALNHFNVVIKMYKTSPNESDHDATISLYKGQSHIVNELQYVKYDELLGISSGMKDDTISKQLFSIEQVPCEEGKLYKIYAVPPELEETNCFIVESTFDTRLSGLNIGAIATVNNSNIDWLYGIPQDTKDKIKKELNL